MRRTASVLAALLLGACATPDPTPEPMTLGPFVGVLPCADCPGISTELTLTRKAPGWAEGGYRLEQTYIDRGPLIVTTGDWTTLRGDAVDEDAVVYQLNPDRPDAARYFRKVGAASVRLLDSELREIPGSAPTILRRAGPPR